MDRQTVMYVTRALDISTTTVLTRQIDQLIEGMDPKGVSQCVLSSLRSLEALQQGKMPEYNSWDAVLYAAWYQPSHINLAYSLIRRVPYEFNPLRWGKGALYVEDFGCGQLAMQFGLLIAASDALESLGGCPSISILSKDPSDKMKEIGWQIWREFKAQISDSKKYPQLQRLREAMARISFHNRFSEEYEHWVSLLHVAYQESKDSVQESVGPVVEENLPRVILVSSHPRARENAFCPSGWTYDKEVLCLSEGKLDLAVKFERLTNLRKSLYEKRVKGLLNPKDEEFARNYLTAYPSHWVCHKFDSECSVYLRANTIPSVGRVE